jgi:Ca2+-binding EF-hand superfamily protein
MQRTIPTAALALCAAVAASNALAQSPAPGAGPSDKPPAEAFMQQLDTDNSGTVSLEEAKAPQREQFNKMDKDGNGTIDAAEARAGFEAQVPEEMLKAMKERGVPDAGETFVKNLDKNGDNVVDAQEFEQPSVQAFEAMDTDGNGEATMEEATAYFDQLRERLQKQMQHMQEQMQQQKMQQEQAPAQ